MLLPVSCKHEWNLLHNFFLCISRNVVVAKLRLYLIFTYIFISQLFLEVYRHVNLCNNVSFHMISLAYRETRDQWMIRVPGDTWGTGGSVLKGWCGLHIKHDWWILAAEKTAKGKLDEVWDTRAYVLNLHTSQLLGHECILGCDRVCTLQIHYNQFLPSGCFLFVATDFLMQFMPSPQFQNRGFSCVNHYTAEPQTHT